MKTIKRYPNRKLYDTGESRYITLEEIATFLRGGGEVRVIDSRTGEDITSVTLAQVLVGEEKRSRPILPGQRLMSMLQSGGDFLKVKLAPVASFKDEAEKTVQRLMHAEAAEEFKEFLIGTQHAYDDLQKKADDRFQTVLAAVRNIAPIHKELEFLRREVRSLSERVRILEGRPPAASNGPRKGRATR